MFHISDQTKISKHKKKKCENMCDIVRFSSNYLKLFTFFYSNTIWWCKNWIVPKKWIFFFHNVPKNPTWKTKEEKIKSKSSWLIILFFWGGKKSLIEKQSKEIWMAEYLCLQRQWGRCVYNNYVIKLIISPLPSYGPQ